MCVKVVASCAQTMGMHVIGYDPVMTPDAFDEVSRFFSCSLSSNYVNAILVIPVGSATIISC
jgi:hypothetical protein